MPGSRSTADATQRSGSSKSGPGSPGEYDTSPPQSGHLTDSRVLSSVLSGENSKAQCGQTRGTGRLLTSRKIVKGIPKLYLISHAPPARAAVIGVTLGSGQWLSSGEANAEVA
jgi:hypothetical protein